jgi:hypothetical protein
MQEQEGAALDPWPAVSGSLCQEETEHCSLMRARLAHQTVQVQQSWTQILALLYVGYVLSTSVVFNVTVGIIPYKTRHRVSGQ